MFCSSTWRFHLAIEEWQQAMLARLGMRQGLCLERRGARDRVRGWSIGLSAPRPLATTLTVGVEVLEQGDGGEEAAASALIEAAVSQALDKGGAHRTRVERVLRVSLLQPSPTRILIGRWRWQGERGVLTDVHGGTQSVDGRGRTLARFTTGATHTLPTFQPA